MEYNESWQNCITRYESLKQREQWTHHAEAMIFLIEKMRADPYFAKVRRLISHQWLRIGPAVDDPSYKPSVWLGSRKPNMYWFGVGSFGTQNRLTVTADHVIPMLKRYLDNLVHIDPEFKAYAPPIQLETLETDGEDDVDTRELEPIMSQWSAQKINEKFETVPLQDLVPALAENLIEQNAELRDFASKLQDIANSIKEVENAEQTVDEMMERIERISAIIDAGLARYRAIEGVETQPIPIIQRQNQNGHG